MSKILELAKNSIETARALRLQESEKTKSEVETALAKLTLNFEQNFAQALPLLKEEGITYKAGIQKMPYFHCGIFIEFTHNGNTLRMDYSTDQWKYEYVPHKESGPYYGTSTFGKWPLEEFYVYLAEKLLSKKPANEVPETDDNLDY